MKRSIQLLSQQTINKIAAGEVVERPASVIKELVENAIDARSTAITVEIKEGGISYLRISDNGIGIPKEQVRTAFLRHSTSKIVDEVDLQTIGTLGFRGEALASIAAVARVEMMTKTREDLTGIRLIIEGGEIKVEEEVGCPEGTTLIIKNLFFNTPARRKFLKRPATEGSYISDFMNRIALGHPEIAFKYMNKSKVALHSSGNNKLRNTIFSVYGKNVVKDLLDLKLSSEDMDIMGFIGKPAIARGNRTYESYYINGRYIKSKIIEKAIHDAYKDFIPPHSFPFLVIHFDMDPTKVDVNVHPTKMEVRFQNEDDIYKLIYEGVKSRLKAEELIPEMSLEKEKFIAKEPIKEYVPEAFQVENKIIADDQKREEAKRVETQEKASKEVKREESKEVSIEVSKEENVDNNPTKKLQDEGNQFHEKREPATIAFHSKSGSNDETGHESTEEVHKEIDSPKSESTETEQVGMELNTLSKVFDHEFTIIGQVFKTYWIIEKEQKMYIVDQHAAHEKVMYERIKASRNDKNNTQMLLAPMIIHLNEAEEIFMKSHRHLFSEFGFVLEEFGDRDYMMRGVPFIFNQTLSKELFMTMLDGLIDEERHIKEDALSDKIALMSCKAAVKGNNKMSFTEMQSLLEQLFTLENPYNCPHGRPTIISMTKYELEKKFKRV